MPRRVGWYRLAGACEEIQPHMTGGHADFRVRRLEVAQAPGVRPQYEADQPLRGIHVQAERGCIPYMEQPAAIRAQGNPAVAAGVPEQGHQPHLRLERQANGGHVEPGLALIAVEHELRLVSDVPADISQVRPAARPAHEGVVFLLVGVHCSVGEIRQPAAVIEVHVGQDDVAHVLRGVAQAGDLAQGRFLRIQGHVRNHLEHAQDRWSAQVIVQAWTCVDQRQPLAGFDQQAQRPAAPVRRYARVASEAVEVMNVH